MPEDSPDVLEVVIAPEELLCQPPGPHHVLGQEAGPAQTLPGVQHGGGEEGVSSLRVAQTKQGEKQEVEEEGDVWSQHWCVIQVKYAEGMNLINTVGRER